MVAETEVACCGCPWLVVAERGGRWDPHQAPHSSESSHHPLKIGTVIRGTSKLSHQPCDRCQCISTLALTLESRLSAQRQTNASPCEFAKNAFFVFFFLFSFFFNLLRQFLIPQDASPETSIMRLTGLVVIELAMLLAMMRESSVAQSTRQTNSLSFPLSACCAPSRCSLSLT